MKVIGITGGIATGKSTISKLFHDNGILVFDADECVNTVLSTNSIVIDSVINKFGNKILIEDGIIDKKILSNIVFSDIDNLQFMQNIMQPIVIEQMKHFINEQRNNKLCVIDIPLLFETNIDKICDLIIATKCDYETQKIRVLKRDNMTEEKFDIIMKNQWSNEYKCNNSDIIIDTMDDFVVNKKQVENIILKLINR